MKCRLCGTEKLKLYYTQGNDDQYKFYKCPNCSLVNYDLSAGLSQVKYSNNFIDPLDKNKKTNRDQTETFKYLKNNIEKKGKLLDIGCGNGRLLLLAREDGWKVKGLELYEFYAESVKNKLGIDVVAANFLDYEPKKNDIYDLIILRHVLEHLPDSLYAMKKIHGLTKSGGHVLLEFPNIEGIDHKTKRFLRRSGIHRKKYKADYRPGHCNEFSRKSFEYLIKKTGFELLDWGTYSTKIFTNFVYKTAAIGSKARALIRKSKDINS